MEAQECEEGFVSVALEEGQRTLVPRIVVSLDRVRVVNLGPYCPERQSTAALNLASSSAGKIPMELLEAVWAFAGSVSAAACGRTCAGLHCLERSFLDMWKGFAIADFGLARATRKSDADWRSVYSCCAHAMHSGECYSLPSAVVEHSDHGGEFRFLNPPAAAVIIPNTPYSCWSTSRGCSTNVDLVAKFRGSALVLGIEVANGPATVGDNPVKDCLAFLSLSEPILPRSSEFNDGGKSVKSKSIAQALLGPRNTDLDSLHTASAHLHHPRGPAEHPVARLTFPPDACFETRVWRPCKATVAGFVHFKILESHNPRKHANPNVDVHELHATGMSLPGLDALLG